MMNTTSKSSLLREGRVRSIFRLAPWWYNMTFQLVLYPWKILGYMVAWNNFALSWQCGIAPIIYPFSQNSPLVSNISFVTRSSPKLKAINEKRKGWEQRDPAEKMENIGGSGRWEIVWCRGDPCGLWWSCWEWQEYLLRSSPCWSQSSPE